MCMPCYKKDGHAHKMERLGFELDGEDSNNESTTPVASRKLSLQRYVQSLEHACQCRDANCRIQSCQTMKKIVAHTRNCKVRV